MAHIHTTIHICNKFVQAIYTDLFKNDEIRIIRAEQFNHSNKQNEQKENK